MNPQYHSHKKDSLETSSRLILLFAVYDGVHVGLRVAGDNVHALIVIYSKQHGWLIGFLQWRRS